MVFLRHRNNQKLTGLNDMKKIIFFTLLMLSQSAFADWVLNNKASKLNFITTKNASKTEVQTFKAMKGSVVNNQVSLTVDLKSVDTGIKIRDKRVRELFFNVVTFPSATVTVDISKAKIGSIKIGGSKVVKFDAVIDLHGVKRSVPVQLQVTALEKDKILVFSNQPVIVDLQNFKLLGGVNKLREIAKLKSINAAVPVTFSLLFDRK